MKKDDRYKLKPNESKTILENRIRNDLASGKLRIPCVKLDLIRFNVELARGLRNDFDKQTSSSGTKVDEELESDLDELKDTTPTIRRSQRGGTKREKPSKDTANLSDESSDGDFKLGGPNESESDSSPRKKKRQKRHVSTEV